MLPARAQRRARPWSGPPCHAGRPAARAQRRSPRRRARRLGQLRQRRRARARGRTQQRRRGVQPLAEGRQRRTGDAAWRRFGPMPVQFVGAAQHRRLQHLPALLSAAVVRRVDLVHARVHHHPDIGGGIAEFVEGVLRDEQQAVQRQHRPAGAERQALRHRAGTAQAGEGAGAATECESVDVLQRAAGLLQQGEQFRQQPRRRLRTALALEGRHDAVAAERDAHRLGRAVDGQQAGHGGEFRSSPVVNRGA